MDPMKKLITTCILLPVIALTMVGCSKKTLPKGAVKEQFIHKYGIAMSEKDWKTHGNSGKVITTMEDGIVITKTFEDGIPSGKATYTFPHSTTVEKTEVYDKGTLTSSIHHYPSGIPMLEEKRLDENNVIVTTWYEDGSPQRVEEYDNEILMTGEYFSFQNELESSVAQKNGTRIHRDAYGNVISKDLIKGGEMVLRTTFHPNGEPKTITTYKDGKPNGTKKTFWIGGVPNTIEEWTEGEQHGVTTLFHNGKKRAEISYIYNIREGKELVFDDNGNIVEETMWRNDVRHGPAKSFVADETMTKWYHYGKRVNKHNFEEMSAIR
jgi:antitoxin component YwqK of YwqJK toxin-antitoxin module